MVDDTDPADEPEVAPTPWLRRWYIRLGIGLVASWAVCSAVAPRYRIPSESMRPGVHAGDHVFTNPWAYWFGEIERGDVMVFRYPLDRSQYFFKRVIGLPGDEVTVDGHRVLLRRAGADEPEELQQVALDEPCVDPLSGKAVPNCTIYEESVDGRSYRVRYRPLVDGPTTAESWKVPEGHLFVMGDSRSDSLDSRRWIARTEAVRADGLLYRRDLDEWTWGRVVSLTRPTVATDESLDPLHDRVIFTAIGDDPPTDADRLELEVWLRPSEGLPSRLAAVRAETPELQDEPSVPGALAATVGGTHVVVVPVESSQTLLRLRCGAKLCPGRDIAVTLAETAALRADDPSTFVDPQAEIPRPFLPLDDVVARVERVVWPPSRFWEPVQ